MLELPKIALPQKTQQELQQFQNSIDRLPDFGTQIKEAKRLFAAKNKHLNPTFRVIHEKLAKMCPGAKQCCYCEFSEADEVEHINPKNFYPNLTFVWENYLYACGPCNNKKRDQFAIFSHRTGQFTKLEHKRGQTPTKPEPGDPAFINPRNENPFQYLTLDLQETFHFAPKIDLSGKDKERAKYTINVLQLNRDALPKARHGAYRFYKALLREYVEECEDEASQERLESLVESIRQMGHPTVWKEMQRQNDKIPELGVLFERAPEALSW